MLYQEDWSYLKLLVYYYVEEDGTEGLLVSEKKYADMFEDLLLNTKGGN